MGPQKVRNLVGKREEKKLLGRPRCRREDNSGMDPQKVGWGGLNWIGLPQDRDRWRALVEAAMNIQMA